MESGGGDIQSASASPAEEAPTMRAGLLLWRECGQMLLVRKAAPLAVRAVRSRDSYHHPDLSPTATQSCALLRADPNGGYIHTVIWLIPPTSPPSRGGLNTGWSVEMSARKFSFIIHYVRLFVLHSLEKWYCYRNDIVYFIIACYLYYFILCICSVQCVWPCAKESRLSSPDRMRQPWRPF